ncbi:MAG: ATP-binding protein [candidate division WOR-3 bacterium]
MSKAKRYCLYRAILFIFLFSLICVFRERSRSILPLVVLFSVFVLDEAIVFFVLKKFWVYNFLLDVTYISFLIVFTGSALSPFVPFYLPLIVLSAYFLFPVDSFIVSGYSILSFGMISLFFTEKIPPSFILISLPEVPAEDIVLIEFIVYSFVFIFTAAISSLVVQLLREQITRIKVDISDIVESIDYGIVAVDEKGYVLWSNSKASKFLGVLRLQGKNLLEVIKNPFRDSISRILSGDERKIEFEDQDKVFMVRSSGLFEEKGTILMINDRTEEKEIEKKMQMRDKLVTLGNFAANLAHEVRNPVSSIRASAELISPSDGGEKNKNNKLREVIIKESDRLDYLVESFLNFTKSFDLSNKEIGFYELIEEVINELKESKYFNKKIKLDNKIKSGISIIGDYNLLKSVFLNLGVNSLKAMSEGGVLIFGVEKENKKTMIFVKDNGCGIKSADLNKIFSPFYTHFNEGFGFGLPIVKKIIELHNWNIAVESIEGKFTEVRITI